jgi:hypothetical protein
MPSRPETIEKARRVRELFRELGSAEAVAARVEQCSPDLVREYMERNSHPLSCHTCGGYGISKKRATGEKRPICNRD